MAGTDQTGGRAVSASGLFDPWAGRLLLLYLFAGSMGLVANSALLFCYETNIYRSPLVTWALDTVAFVPQDQARGAVLAVMATIAVLLVIALAVWVRKGTCYSREGHDLLYYLGFIGTVIGLLFASLTLVFKPGEAGNATISTMIAQNGVALGSTLVGMILRNSFRYLYSPPLTSLHTVREAIEQLDAAAKKASSSINTIKAPVGAMSETVGQLGAQIGSLGEKSGTTAKSLAEQQADWAAFTTTASTLNANLASSANMIRAIAESLSGVPQRAVNAGNAVSYSVEQMEQRVAALRRELMALEQQVLESRGGYAAEPVVAQSRFGRPQPPTGGVEFEPYAAQAGGPPQALRAPRASEMSAFRMPATGTRQ